ncbi:hypothetical protein DFP72DRAFT_1078385 [Ephemerocybe angulata]|uniref:GmrSD restriction endonucleases N-terminal domain-containing protein n=1 Tax=Ephemerocybe angulata TaxID=980116 RepID=A0A8H6HE06_9AGAR|nr:hypothetical protein DFP72DRAFT_1078385 [Tulosesus angulatus]
MSIEQTPRGVLHPKNVDYLMALLDSQSIGVDKGLPRKVWPVRLRKLYIQSLNDNYPIGSIVLRKESSESNRMIIIDSGQRIGTIKLFLSGQIPYISCSSKKAIYFKQVPGAPSREVADREWKTRFLNQRLDIFIYNEMSDDEARRVYQLMNC